MATAAAAPDQQQSALARSVSTHGIDKDKGKGKKKGGTLKDAKADPVADGAADAHNDFTRRLMLQLNTARQELAEMRRERDASAKLEGGDGAPTIAAINADLRDLRSAAERARSTVSFSVQRESADCETLRAENARLTALNSTLMSQFDAACEESDELRRQLETCRGQYAEMRAASSQHDAHLREMAAHVRAIALAQSEIGALMSARFSSSVADSDASGAAAPGASGPSNGAQAAEQESAAVGAAPDL